jgi:hypothetical protein
MDTMKCDFQPYDIECSREEIEWMGEFVRSLPGDKWPCCRAHKDYWEKNPENTPDDIAYVVFERRR